MMKTDTDCTLELNGEKDTLRNEAENGLSELQQHLRVKIYMDYLNLDNLDLKCCEWDDLPQQLRDDINQVISDVMLEVLLLNSGEKNERTLDSILKAGLDVAHEIAKRSESSRQKSEFELFSDAQDVIHNRLGRLRVRVQLNQNEQLASAHKA